MELLLFAIIVLIVAGLIVAVWWYVPAPGPIKWIVPAAVLLLAAVAIFYRLMGAA